MNPAPLFVVCHDLALDLAERTARFSDDHRAAWGAPLLDASRELAVAVSLALSFPRTRSAHQARADEQLVRLRVLLALARASGALSDRAFGHLTERVTEAGRMLGGWRKRQSRHEEGGGLSGGLAPPEVTRGRQEREVVSQRVPTFRDSR